MPARTTLISVVLVSTIFTTYAAAQTATFAQPRARVLSSVNEYSTFTLGGNVHPLAAANPSEALDPSAPMEHMVLYLDADPAQEAQLTWLVEQQSDPKSPLYHKFLTPQDFGSQFGIAETDLEKVTAWLKSNGFNIEEVPESRRAIVFSGTSGQVSQAFKTEIGRFNIGGTIHHANTTDPQIPSAFAGVIGGIVKLHDFRHKPSISKVTSLPQANFASPKLAASGGNFLAPADYATIYDINSLYSAKINGSGQSIAVLARSNILLSDVQLFRSTFDLSANQPQIVITNQDPGVLEDDSTETTLDTEWSGAVAPGATVKVIVSSSTATADGIDLSALYAVNNNVAPIVSLSYGSCEADMGSSELAFYNSLWKQAVAQGMSVMVSAGDSGASGCDGGSANTGSGRGINGLCSSPYSTCVGGTEFVEGNNPGEYWLPTNNGAYGSAISYIPEAVWNESASDGGSGLWSGGGGVSKVYAKPSWQTGLGVPADGYRDVPDVSLTAADHDGYVIIQFGNMGAVGGTSASAPSFAGLMSLVDQKTNARQGLANATLYPLAANQVSGGAKVFHDITSGNNSVPNVTGFNAGTGYDEASGLGSVDAALLVNNWTNVTQKATPTFALTSSATSISVTAGNSGKVALSTTPQGGFNSSIALSVSGLPSGVTSSFSATAISGASVGSSTLTLTTALTAKAGTYNVVVTATGGGITKTLTVSLVVTAAPNTFNLTVSQSTLAIKAGASGQVSVTTANVGIFNSSVALSVSGMPTGVTASFSKSAMAAPGNGTATLTVAASTTVTGGTYGLVIKATGGGVTQSSTVSLTLTAAPNTFNLAVSQSTLAIKAGASGQVSVTTANVGIFNSSVALSVSGMPTGVTASFSKSAMAAPGNGTATLTVAASATVTGGTYGLVIKATGGGVTQSSTVSLTLTAAPNTFNLTVSQSTLAIKAGASGQVSVTTANVGIFNSSVALSVSGMPTGVTASFSKSAMAAPGNGTATLTVVASATVTGGTYSLVIKATGGGVTQSSTVSLTLTAALNSFNLTATQSTLSAKVGATAQTSLTTAHAGIFNSSINLSVSGMPSGVTASFSKSAIAAPGDGTVSLTVAAGSTAKAGTYPLTVSATGAGQTKTSVITLTIIGSANFSLQVNLGSVTLAQGGSAGAVVVSTGDFTGGFNAGLTVTFSGLGPGMNWKVTGSNASNNMVNTSVVFTASSTAATGIYPVTVTATGGGITHTAVVQATVTKSTTQTTH